jgi:surface antigen
MKWGDVAFATDRPGFFSQSSRADRRRGEPMMSAGTKIARDRLWAERLLMIAGAAMLTLTVLAVPDEARAWQGPGTNAAPAPPAAQQRCHERNRSRGRALGGALGFGGELLGGHGNVARTVVLATALTPAGALLGDAIAGLLDCDEQQRATSATEAAVSGGVGTTTNWTSATRPGVTGSSTVTAADTSAEGDCLTVTDIVIIDGEETRAPKRLCRHPPSNRYARV